MKIEAICESIYRKIVHGSTVERAIADTRETYAFIGENIPLTDDELRAKFAKWDARVHGDDETVGEEAKVPGLRALFRF